MQEWLWRFLAIHTRHRLLITYLKLKPPMFSVDSPKIKNSPLQVLSSTLCPLRGRPTWGCLHPLIQKVGGHCNVNLSRLKQSRVNVPTIMYSIDTDRKEKGIYYRKRTKRNYTSFPHHNILIKRAKKSPKPPCICNLATYWNRLSSQPHNWRSIPFKNCRFLPLPAPLPLFFLRWGHSFSPSESLGSCRWFLGRLLWVFAFSASSSWGDYFETFCVLLTDEATGIQGTSRPRKFAP